MITSRQADDDDHWSVFQGKIEEILVHPLNPDWSFYIKQKKSFYWIVQQAVVRKSSTRSIIMGNNNHIDGCVHDFEQLWDLKNKSFDAVFGLFWLLIFAATVGNHDGVKLCSGVFVFY